ncbi:MAG: hypothetical protein LBU70_00700 [Chitinispirillales bacterium]|jgi:outer membrane usher protein FimD/PapC|nr:hypothetical protein [Chitinispirillales bacterium]
MAIRQLPTYLILCFLLGAARAFAFDITPIDPDSLAQEQSRQTPEPEPPADVSPPPVITEPSAPADLIRRPQTREELGQMSREELFRLAFGRAAPDRPRSLMVRLLADNRNFGDVEVVYSEDFSTFSFVSVRFSNYLDGIILPDLRNDAGDDDGYFCSSLLAHAGYMASVDEMAFELRVVIPPESKTLQRTNLSGGHARVPRGERIDRAHVSFYMNYRLVDRMMYRLIDYDDSFVGHRHSSEVFERFPASLNFDGALASFGWVLEGSAVVREPLSGREWTWEDNFYRGDMRVVRDIIRLDSRLSLGEVGLATEILGGDVVGGIRYEHNGWFFGNDPRDRHNSVYFFMPRSGEVELYAEGRYVDRFRLPAGHHEITGFGGNIGRNRVRLVLRMDDGSTEEVPFEFIQSDPRNAARGDLRYSMTAGIRREAELSPWGYRYSTEVPAVSADFLYGLHHFVSVGLAGLASPYSGETGAQVLWTMGKAGQLNFHGFMSYADYEHIGKRVSVSYTANLDGMVRRFNRLFTDTGGMERRILPRMSFSLRGHYQDGSYFSAGLLESEFREGVNTAGVSGNFGFGLFRGNITATGGVDFRGDTVNRQDYSIAGYNYGVRVSQSVNKVSFNLNAGTHVRDDVSRPYFSFNSNYSIGSRIKRHNFAASTSVSTRSIHVQEHWRPIEYPDSVSSDPEFDEPTHEIVPEHYRYDWAWRAQAGWRWSNRGSGTWAQSYSADINIPNLLGEHTRPEFSASLRQNYNRAQFAANYGQTNNITPTLDQQTHVVNATLSGSFMFADGLWAFGRPITDGFLLVDTRHGLRGAKVHMNRSRHTGQDMSRNGWLGAAYHNRVMAYHAPTEITLTLTEAPIGAVLQNNVYHMLGTYKQGYALRIGTRENILLLTRLTSGGKPINYTYITVEAEDSRGENRRATFTGNNGALQIGDLVRGRTYRISFGSQQVNFKDLLIQIPRDAGTIFELPDIEVERVAD